MKKQLLTRLRKKGAIRETTEYPNTVIVDCLGFGIACEQNLILTTIHPSRFSAD